MGETEIVFGEAAGTADDNLETDPSMPLNGRRQETAGRTPIIATTRPGQDVGTVRVPAGRDGGCPACHGAFEFKRGGVVTTTSEGVAARVRSRVGHCSTCGVRLASCPACASANLAPNLVAQIACRDCAEMFEAR
jgi:hypothetical protein